MNPVIQIIISFADPSQNHNWTIYQATNFYFCWTSNWWKCLVTADWYTQHTRLLWIYKKRHRELKGKTNKEIMEIYWWTYKQNSWKYRYVFLRWKKKNINKNIILDKIKPYPNKEILKTFDKT